MLKLYEISAIFNNFIELCEEPDADLENMEKALQSIELEFSDKLNNCGKFIKNNEAEVAGLDVEIKRLQARKKTVENRNSWMKSYILNQMGQMSKDKVKTELFQFSIQKNPESVIISDESKIPEKFLVTTTSINKTEIKNEIKAGVAVPGASLESKGEFLKIK